MRRALIAALLFGLSGLPVLLAEGGPKGPPPGWLGVMVHAAGGPEGTAAAGVRIGAVIEESPAELAGVRARDLLLSADGIAIHSGSELIRHISALPPGSWVDLALERRGEPLELRVKLEARPAETTRMKPRQGWIGLDVIDLPQSLREHFGAPAEAGVMVSEIVPGSPGASAGFELGDVLIEVDGEQVRTRGELLARLRGGGVGNVVELAVVRDGSPLQLEAMILPAPER
jgi:serine protease Do